MNKYYTPKIEEFYVGFEYESLELGSQTKFNKDIVTDNHLYGDYDQNTLLSEIYFHPERARVKYLDKADIESLGFKDYKKSVCNWYKLEGRFEDSFSSYGYWSKIRLIHCPDNNVIKILAYEYSWDEEENVLYAGKCNNKSELKKLLTQLSILKDGEEK